MKSHVWKRVSALLLALCLIGALVPAAARAVTDRDQMPAHELIVEGGTVAIEGVDEYFTGTVREQDVVIITLTPQQGRTFLRWRSADGVEVTAPDFRAYIRGDLILFPEFEDTKDYPFGEWELFRDGDCEEGKIYRRVNEKSDVQYKMEFVNGGMHSFDDYVPVDDEVHKAVCSACGAEQLSLHEWGSEVVTKEPTHAEEGEATRTCWYCHATVTSPIPKTEEHVYGPWEITVPSVDGQYGQRTRRCLYCDHSETYWYLDVDYRQLFEGRGIWYQDTYGGKVTNNERYFSYPLEDGRIAYIWGEQYVYSYSSGNDYGQTYVFLFIDDGDASVLKPVYLSRSRNDSVPSAKWALYGYAYDFDEWLEVLRYPDLVVTDDFGGDFTFGNAMSARASALHAWANDWAEEFNSAMIPADKDPASFVTTDGSFGKWEACDDGAVFAYAYDTVYPDEGGEEQLGGFANCTEYRKWVSGEGDDKVYNYMIVDNDSGLTVSESIYTTYYATRRYFNHVRDVVTGEEYEALPEYKQWAYVNQDDMAKLLQNFCQEQGRNSFYGLDMEIPDPPTSVRVIASGNYKVTYDSYWNAYWNSPHVYPVPQSESDESRYKMTLEWDEDKANGSIFDRWEVFDFETMSWVTFSEEKSITFNTFAAPLTGPTILRTVSHVSDVRYTIRVVGGTFLYNDEFVTEATLPENTTVDLLYDDVEGKFGDHWEDTQGNTYYSSRITVTRDETYTAFYRDQTYSICFEAYDGHGTVFPADEPGAADTYIYLEGTRGQTLSVDTAPEAGSDYTTFLGWYEVIWGKMGESFELLTHDRVLSYTIEGYPDGNVAAVWSDGSFSEEDLLREPDKILVDVEGGFAAVGPYEAVADACPGLESQWVDEYSRLWLIDDPNDGVRIGAWTVTWTNEEGEQTETVDVDFTYPTEYYIRYMDLYQPGLHVTITGVPVEPCADGEHTMSDWSADTDGQGHVLGTHSRVCTACGFRETASHGESEWTTDRMHHCKHCDVCDCDYCEGEHVFESAVTREPTTEAEGERTYTCTQCQYSYTEAIEKLEDTGGDVTNETEPEDNAMNADIVLEEGQTLESVFFTEDERARIAAGENASVRLTVTEAGMTMDDGDKALIDGQAGEQRVLLYLEIVIEKQIGTDDPVRVTETAQPVTIRVHLPQPEAGQKSLRCTAVCVHNGTVIVLNGEKDGEYFNFTSSQFSSYGLIVSLAGDLNTDGKVNNKDALMLFRRVSGIPVAITVSNQFLDLNADGNVNNKDALLLFRFVSGLNVTLK